jgi:hypothetical protein
VLGIELLDAQHVHELVDLLLDLLEEALVALHPERDARTWGRSVVPTARLSML